MTTNDKPKREYTTTDMLKDFSNPIEKVKASDLADKGDLTIDAVRLVTTEKYGDCYVGTFTQTDGEGMTYESFIQAKQPYAVFDTYKDALIGAIVRFNVITTRDGNTILKCYLVKSTKALDKALA